MIIKIIAVAIFQRPSSYQPISTIQSSPVSEVPIIVDEIKGIFAFVSFDKERHQWWIGRKQMHPHAKTGAEHSSDIRVSVMTSIIKLKKYKKTENGVLIDLNNYVNEEIGKYQFIPVYEKMLELERMFLERLKKEEGKDSIDGMGKIKLDEEIIYSLNKVDCDTRYFYTAMTDMNLDGDAWVCYGATIKLERDGLLLSSIFEEE